MHLFSPGKQGDENVGTTHHRHQRVQVCALARLFKQATAGCVRPGTDGGGTTAEM